MKEIFSEPFRQVVQLQSGLKNQKINFKTGIFSIEGKDALFYEVEIPLDKAKGIGEKSAFQVLKKGGSKLMKKIKSQMR